MTQTPAPSFPGNPSNPTQDSIMEVACQFFQSQLTDRHRTFLGDRYGLTPDTVDKFRIGFCPVGWNHEFFIHLMGFGFDPQDIENTGLFSVGPGWFSPMWRGRLMFPYLEGGKVRYFIGRETDETKDGKKDQPRGKYKKQLTKSEKRPNILAYEPIFGSDSVTPGEPVIVTEGITDAIITIQAGYACISPVTVRFKSEHGRRLADLVRDCSQVVLLMDSEDNQAGEWGAVDTGLELCRHGIIPFIGTIPRPEGVDKVDLNDYIREGGDVSDLITQAVLIDLHPLARLRKRELWKKAGDKMAAGMVRDHYQANPPKNQTKKWDQNGPTIRDKKEIVKRYLPPLSHFTGFHSGQGPHPIYGSKTGVNLEVTGDIWYTYHQGHQGGGDVFTWIAIYDLSLIREGQRLEGLEFIKTVNYCWEKYVPEDIRNGPKNGTKDTERGPVSDR